MTYILGGVLFSHLFFFFWELSIHVFGPCFEWLVCISLSPPSSLLSVLFSLLSFTGFHCTAQSGMGLPPDLAPCLFSGMCDCCTWPLSVSPSSSLGLHPILQPLLISNFKSLILFFCLSSYVLLNSFFFHFVSVFLSLSAFICLFSISYCFKCSLSQYFWHYHLLLLILYLASFNLKKKCR